MKKGTLIVACLFCNMGAFSQFNDTTHYLVSYASTGVLNKSNSKSSYVLSNALRFAIRHKNISLNNASNWVYGWQQQSLTNNDVSSVLDFNLYKTIPRFYYWGLAAYDKSYSLKIRYRWQGGIGIAYSFVDRETAFLNISDGILYEAGSLQISDSVKNAYQTFRNSLRLRYHFVINRIVMLDGSHFWQPSLHDGKDYILKSGTTLSVKLREWLSIMAAANYNKVSRTQRENLLITFGLTAEKYF